MINPPCLFIANHSSHVDTLSLIRALPPNLRRRTAIAAADDYFYRRRLLAHVLTLFLNSFPFSRAGNVRSSLGHCGDLADGGWSILIYPEGTRSTTGRLLPFKSGIGLLAKGLRMPVVPIGVSGGFEILPKGRSLPRRGSVTVRFGDPLTFAEDADAAEVTAKLEAAVERLLPLELKRARRTEEKGQTE